MPPTRPTGPTSSGPGLRTAVESRSAVVLVFLRTLPRAVPALVVVVLVGAGLSLPGLAGAVALLVVLALLGWLAYLSWPALNPVARALRLLVLALLAAAAVSRALS